MNDCSFGHLSNEVAWNSYIAAESHELAGTAKTLALLAEVDERKLYLPAGYASMCDYCMRARRMTKDRALKRIRVARAGREFPAIFPAIAEGRLGLTAVLLLVPQLTAESADELLAFTSHKTNEEIEQLLAARNRQSISQMQLAPTESGDGEDEVAVRPPVPCTASDVALVMEPIQMAPAPKHSGWRYAYSAAREEKLGYVHSLLAHSKPGASVDQLLDLALDCLRDKLETQKFGKCSRPGKARGSDDPRYIPREVKREVWARDGGQCTFVASDGTRCAARDPLEFDHVVSVARGGRSTVPNVRLLCRAHNQFAAEQTYGADFMKGKREQARERKAKAQAEEKAKARAAKEQERALAAAEKASQEEVVPWLQALGCNLERARAAATRCQGMVGQTLERRVFTACQGLGPRGSRRALPVSSGPA